MANSDTASASQLSKVSSSGLHVKKTAEARHLYPLLQCFESSWPTLAVLAGIVIESAQILALVINHLFPWGGIVSGIGVPLYFTILPVWDQKYYLASSFSEASVLFWIFITVLVAFLVSCGVLMHQIAEQIDRHGQGFGKLVLHVVTGVFFQPILHLLLAFAVCDQNAHHLTAFPSTGCLESFYSILMFAVAVAAMGVLCLMKIVTTLFLYEDHPASLHLRARSHNIVELSMTTLEILLAVLFHFLPANGMKMAFAGIFALGCAVVAALHVFFLPMYQQQVNSFRVVTLTVSAFAGMLATVLLDTSHLPSSNTGKNWSSLFLLASGSVVAFFAYLLSNVRVSRTCLRDLKAAMSGEASANDDKALFPHNLPCEERIRLRENESIMLGEMQYARTQETLTGPQLEREENRDDLWVCSPYLEAVYCVTDVEAATRHIFLFQHLTALRVPSSMVAMGVRIYTKGLSRFFDAPWLELQFATFMCSLAPQRNPVSLALCEKIMRYDVVGMFLGYRVTRRAASISAAMFIRDNSHKKSFVAAQQMHKEALINMKLFWGKLLADQVDIVQLGMLAKIITDRREEGLKFFERVVNESNDTFSLIRYAQFMDQVMMDSEAANNTRESVLDVLEQEQMGVAGGTKGAAGSQQAQKGGANLGSISSRQRSTSISRSRTISSLNFNINVIFSVLFFVIGGLLVFGIVLYVQRTDTASKLQTAGLARGYCLESVMYVNMLAQSTTTDLTFFEASARGLKERTDSFRESHAELTHGKYKTSNARVREVFTKPLAPFLLPNAAEAATMGLWELGDALSNALETILSSETSDDARQYAIGLVRENAVDNVARLYNESVTEMINESTGNLQVGQYVMIGFYLLSLLILASVYFVLILNFRKISSSKLSTLSLFTLIPKNALEKLMLEGKRQIDAFDEPDAVFESMKAQRGLEDDRDVMKQVLAQDDISDGEIENSVFGSRVAGGKSDSAVGGPAHGHGAGGDDPDELDIHGKFASLLRNSTVGDTGKMKLVHHGQYEPPYPKDAFAATKETVEEQKERQRQLNELHVEDDLKAISDNARLMMLNANSSGGDGGSDRGSGVDDDSSTTDHRDKTHTAALTSVMSSASVIILVLLVVVAGLHLGENNRLRGIKEQLQVADAGIRNLYAFYSATEDIRVAAEDFIYSPMGPFVPGGKERFTLMQELILGARQDSAFNEARQQQRNDVMLGHLFKAREVQQVLFNQQLVLVMLVCRNNPVPPGLPYTYGTCSRLNQFATEWRHDLFLPPRELRLYHGDLLTDKWLTPENLVIMSPSNRTDAARKHLSSGYYKHLTTHFATYLRQAIEVLETEIETKVRETATDVYHLTIAQVSLSALLVATIAATLIAQRGNTSVPTFTAGMVVILLASMALIGLVIPRCQPNNGDLLGRTQRIASLRDLGNQSAALSTFNHDRAARILFAADAVAAMDLEADGGLRAAEEAWARFEGIAVPQSTQLPLTTAFDNFRKAAYVDLIAAAVACSARGVFQPPALSRLWWNFTAEVFRDRLAQQFPQQVFYSNRVADLSSSAAAQMTLATHLLYGPFRSHFVGLGVSQFEGVRDNNVQLVKDEVYESIRLQTTLVVAGIIVAFGAAAVSVALLVVRLFEFIAASNTTRVGGSESSQREDELFQKLTKQSQASCLIVAALFSVLFIFTMLDFGSNMRRSYEQNFASLREYFVVRSYAETHAALNKTWYSYEARNTLERMMDVADRLYFGDGVNSAGVVHERKALDTAIFGPTEPQTRRFDCSLANSKQLLTGNITLPKVLALAGVDPAMKRLAHAVRMIDVLSLDSDKAARILSIEAEFELFLSSMRASTAEFTSVVKDAATSGLIGFLVILAITFVVLALLFALVFRPMIGQLLNEEEGTKVMLKMIPAEVRESVPAIAEYLETGVVMQDMKMHEVNEAAADLSTIPTITIDTQGTIVKFSRAAEDAFLWTKSEAVGSNVKILMPDNIAVEHDGYLSRYRRTGVKTIINKQRTIRARRKDGSLFPAEIFVREIRNGRSTQFVGTLRNISVEIEFERAIILSKAVSEAATVPIIVINSKGVILRFNAAAEEAFKCGSQDVIGRKVNVLMPAAEAEVHDSYLERYAKTGIQTVVNQNRYIRAKRISGELFPARLSVRELKRGNDAIFIGYMEDVTKKVHLQMTSMVSDAIMATSPVPLIAIDDVGSIISWSPAAAHTFGLPVQDAIGKNIKLVMPDAIAQRHDGYLQAYQKTGRKKMIGNVVSQKAKRREEDGSVTLFSVKIAVKDIVQQGKNNYYVAFVQDVSRQQQLETEYKISSSLTSLSPLPLVTINEKGIITNFSLAAETCFGFAKDEVIGQNVSILMPPEHRNSHDGYLERYLKTGVKTVIDIHRKLTATTKDGTLFPIEIMVREVKHDGSYNFVAYIRNISDDAKMANENAYSDAISQLAVVPVVCMNMEGIIIACSDSTCERFLWSRDELIGQNIRVLMPETVGAKHDGYLQRYKERLAVSGPDKAREQSTMLHKERRVLARARDEQTFEVSVHVRDLHIPGMPPVFVGLIRDVSDEISQAIQKRVAETIVSLSSIPLICIDHVGTVSLFSASAEKDFGYAASEVLGKNIKMLMPEDIATKHDGYLRAYAKTGVKSVIDSRRQVTARRKNGVVFSVEITVKEVIQKDPTGKDIVEYIGFVRNLSQQFILMQANTINVVVSELATVPIVTIDPRGIILDFNNAATREFGYTIEEAVSQNIRMLMPDDVAAMHNGYLQKYRLTRKKTVIDTTTRLFAKRKNGSQFPCEISVREVIKEGTEGQFIGYIRDVSHEQELAKQHKINSAIIDLSITPIIVIDIRGEISIFSRAAEECFGYSRQEVEGKNIKMLMPSSVAAVHDGYLAAYARTGVKNIIDTSRSVRAKKKDGTTFPAEISVREVIGDDGNSIFIGYLQDCTEEAMQNAAAAFSECVNELSPVPVIAIDHLGTIVRFSLAAEEEFGVRAADIVGKNVKVLQPPEVAAVHDEYLARYLRTGVKTILGKTRILTARRFNGELFQSEITVCEVRDVHDRSAPPNFVAYLRNIEDDLRIEEAFKEGNAMLDLSPIPVISISLRGVILDVNPAALQTFRYTRAEMIHKNIKMLMPPNIAAEHDMYLQRYLDTGNKHVIDSVRHVVAMRKGNVKFHVEIAVREIHVEGTENMYLGYVRDVTEDLKMAEAAALNEAVNSLSSTPLVVTDPFGTILKFSQAAEDLFGYTCDEVLNKNVKILMNPNVAIKHDRFLESYRTTRVKHVIDSTRQVEARRKDGSSFACEIGVREVMAQNGMETAVFVGYVHCLDTETLKVGQSAEINGMMMDLAVQGVMLIDRYGTIERINAHALEMFHIPNASDVIGKNIKLLMPDSIAEKHDGYLATYYTTRVKHVIDSTRQAQAKEWGTNKVFPIEIAVRELVEPGKEIRYLGYVRRIERDLEILTVKKTSAAALELSPYATVVIDGKGTILMFSRAAELLFEVVAKDMIGKNVKVLMPLDVAARHDDYLATYRRTGQKHVVDSVRHVTAKSMRTGEPIQVQLQIKECTFSIRGLESVFVGYISRSDHTTGY